VIDGVIVHPLRQFPDERGRVMHMLRASDPYFRGFGEIYFSVVYPGAVKGWHLHQRMVLNYAVPHGPHQVLLFDPRPDSATRGGSRSCFLGPDHYCLVQVPGRGVERASGDRRRAGAGRQLRHARARPGGDRAHGPATTTTSSPTIGR